MSSPKRAVLTFQGWLVDQRYLWGASTHHHLLCCAGHNKFAQPCAWGGQQTIRDHPWSHTGGQASCLLYEKLI